MRHPPDPDAARPAENGSAVRVGNPARPSFQISVFGTAKKLEIVPPPRRVSVQATEPAEPAQSPSSLYELALTSAAMSFHQAAIDMLHELLGLAPDHGGAWRTLARLLRLAGRDGEAAQAVASAIGAGHGDTKYPRLAGERSPMKLEKADAKLQALMRRTPPAERPGVLRDHLLAEPLDVTAMRLLAEQEWRKDDGVTATCLLERALELSPGFTAARRNYTELLAERRQYARVVQETDRLGAQAVRDPQLRGMRADALGQIGRYGEALGLYESLIKAFPRHLHSQIAYAGALHYAGRREDSVQAYRACLALDPASGDAYWGLADLKGNHLTDQDVLAMRRQLDAGVPDSSQRMHMLYALAHAQERRREYADSFASLMQGAAAFQDTVAGTPKAHKPDFAADRVRRLRSVFTADAIAARAPNPNPNPAGGTPIFVVGMPRAGSTLVEQILASHSLVEGTRELPLIGDITRELTISRAMVTEFAYPECVLDLTAEELAALGARYLQAAEPYRHTDRPYFIDKRPWNWLDAGLIRLILPHAKIIDIRRDPMAACFAMFKQLLPIDAAFSYDLGHLGRYYRDYVRMMDHHAEAMPGHIHFVRYERLVENTETEIRALLEFCGLPFEESCLRFWETDRAVFTPSAEQVRRPIFRDAVAQWRNFEPWLGTLKAALAPT